MVCCWRFRKFEYVPSVVESLRLPPPLVAPPLSRSLEPLTPESALQEPRSPGNSPKPRGTCGALVGVIPPVDPLILDTDMDANDS